MSLFETIHLNIGCNLAVTWSRKGSKGNASQRIHQHKPLAAVLLNLYDGNKKNWEIMTDGMALHLEVNPQLSTHQMALYQTIKGFVVKLAIA